MAKTICASWLKSVGKTLKNQPKYMKSTITRKAPVRTITFYSLLEKYDGKILKATPKELAMVKPNGLKALFQAWRVYEKLNPKSE